MEKNQIEGSSFQAGLKDGREVLKNIAAEPSKKNCACWHFLHWFYY